MGPIGPAGHRTPVKSPSLPVIILAIVVLAVVIGVIPISVVIAACPFLLFIPFVEFVQNQSGSYGGQEGGIVGIELMSALGIF